MTRARSWTLPRPADDRGSRSVSFMVAVVLHALLGALLLTARAPLQSRPGPVGRALSAAAGDGGGGGGGGGGERIHLLHLPPPPADALPDLPATPRVATPDLILPDPSLTAMAEVLPSMPEPVLGGVPGAGRDPSAGLGAGAGGGRGGGTGPGVGPGSGPKSGGGTGGGDGVRPPAPLTILIPPPATASVRGKAATMRLQVDSSGAVRDADVVVSSGDRGYDEKLRRIAMGWRFRPARDAANRAVPYPFEVSLRF